MRCARSVSQEVSRVNIVASQTNQIILASVIEGVTWGVPGVCL